MRISPLTSPPNSDLYTVNWNIMIPLFLLSHLEAEFGVQYSLSHWTMSNLKARAMSQFS